MKKVALLPLLIVAGCLISGLYGALHNQISYSVSPEYFHAFKFHQFGIPEGLHNRIGASIVGWRASWWMGLIIGVPVSLVGLVMPDSRTYLTRSLIAFAVVAVTALVMGLGALAYASLPEYWHPESTTDRMGRAWTMHYYSYLGGVLGILTGPLYLVVERIRLARRRSRPARPAAALDRQAS